MTLCGNASGDSNITSELWLVEDKISAKVASSFLLLILVVGLPWNLLVVGIILKKKLYTQPTIILLLNLVLTDIFMLILLTPSQVWVGFNGEYNFGDTDSTRCKVCQFKVLVILFPLTSLYNISYMSIDRFIFIYKPFKYDRIITRFRTLLVLILTYIFATLIAALPIIGYGRYGFDYHILTCDFDHSVDNSYYFIVLLIYALLPVVPIAVCNMGLLCIVQKNITAIYSVRGSQSTTPKSEEEKFYKDMKKQRLQKQLHLVWVFGALICCNLVTWPPIVIHNLISIAEIDIPASVSTTFLILFTSQALAHPVVETLLIKEVREPCKTFIFSSCTKVKPNDSASTPTSVPSANCCGCHGGDAGSSQSTGCSGCGLLIGACSDAVMMNYTHSSRSDSHNTNEDKSESKA